MKEITDQSYYTNQWHTQIQPLEDFLAVSGLRPEDVPDWKLVNKFEINRLLRIEDKSKIRCDCVAIPYFTFGGDQVDDRGEPFFRARLLEPERRGTSTKKYASPSGSAAFPYLPRKLRHLLEEIGSEIDHHAPPLVITEGEKKAEALVKVGIPCIGLMGIAMGMVRDDPSDKDSPRKLVMALAEAIENYVLAVPPEQTPRVLVLFDSDGLPGDAFPGSHSVGLKTKAHVGNKSVYFEALKLAKELRNTAFAREIVVSSGWCPPGPQDENGIPGKRGIDDWIEGEKQENGTAEIVIDAIHELATPDSQFSNTNKANKLESYKVLGLEDGVVVVWSRASLELVKLTASDLSKPASIMLAVGPEVAFDSWPNFNKDGYETGTINVQKAAADLILKAHETGAWISTRERGGGVWLGDEGELRINAREGFFKATSQGLRCEEDEQRYSGSHIYPACGRFSIGHAHQLTLASDAGRELGSRLLKHLRNWGWRQKTSHYVVAGWICQQAYLGALNARPSITLVGESGAGKSVLAEHVGSMLGGTAYRIEDGAGTSAAGLRQTIGKDAISILLDEAEPGANQHQVAEQRAASMRRNLDMLRAAYSASDGAHVRTTIKGSPSGKPVDYSIRTCAMLNAISRPDFDQADRNRFLLVEMTKAGRSASEPSDDGLDELGFAIRAVLWQRWQIFNAIYRFIVSLTDMGETRLRKTWGTPIAAWATLIYGDEWETKKDAIAEMAFAVAADQSSQGGDENESDQEKARKALLSALIDCEVSEARGGSMVTVMRKKTVHEVFSEAKKSNPKTLDNAAAQSLKRVGLMRVDREDCPHLFVSDNAQLRAALRGTSWASGQSIVHVLARLEDAIATTSRPRDTRPKFGGSKHSGVFIPVTDEDVQSSDVLISSDGNDEDM